jgi:hypothetical protein
MATQLKIKQSSVASKVPVAADLVQGELALNTTDKKLYSKDSSGNIIEIGGSSAGNLNAADTQVQEFTNPTVGTTTFAVTGGFSASDTITVYNNGIRLAASDYTATSPNVVLATGTQDTNDVITITKISINSVYAGSEIETYEYTVTAATQTDFNATYDADKSYVDVYVNGIKLLGDDYVKTTGTKIVLDVAAVTGDDVVVKVIRLLTLTGIAQTDWTQTDTTSDDYLKNKPFITIGTGLSVSSGVLNASAHLLLNNTLTSTSTTLALTAAQGKILNDGKAALVHSHDHSALTNIVANQHIDWTTDQGATNIHAGNYTDTNTTYTGGTGITLTGTVFSTAAEVNVQSDWTETATGADSFIKNRPATFAPSAHSHDHSALTNIVTNQHIDWTASGAGSIHATNIPAIALTTVKTAANQVDHLALVTEEGDIVVRSDESKSYVRNSGSAGTMADFTLLLPSTSLVLSVDGAVGAVVLNHDSLAGFVANEHIDWTTDQGATNIHAGNYTDTNTTYTGGTGITLTGTVFSTAAEVNIQSDWNQGTAGADDFIKNKPNVQYTSAIPNATTSASGLMASGDKTKLDGISTSANNYVHPTTAGNKHIPTGGSAGEFLKYSASGTAVWSADNDTIYVHPTTAGNKHIPTGGAANQYLKYSASGVAVWADIAADTNTTYTHKISETSGVVGIDLDPSSGSTDTVKVTGSGSTTISRVDADTINITSTDNSIAMAIALGG